MNMCLRRPGRGGRHSHPFCCNGSCDCRGGVSPNWVMSCPVARDGSPPRPLRDARPCYYHEYLALDDILSAQRPRSAQPGRCEAHDETLFIITHQAYELWFKQIIHDLTSCVHLWQQAPCNFQLLNERLQRITKIQSVLLMQLPILETMTPVDFLSFRDYLFPASGFQSVQFKQIETMLGLPASQRLQYNTQTYTSTLRDEHRQLVEEAQSKPTCMDCLQHVLEGIDHQIASEFQGSFWQDFMQPAMTLMQHQNRQHLNSLTGMRSDALREALRAVDDQDAAFDEINDPAKYEDLVQRGLRRLSLKAFRAAVIVHQFRHEPRFAPVFTLMTLLMEIDNNLSKWRFHHAAMVHRFLGLKSGTGGSSGVSYLRATCSRHIVFGDLFATSQYLLPAACLPPLPDAMRY
ncbi:Tryptophan 2,3-dioxygenase [Plasmodiophora brassicae]